MYACTERGCRSRFKRSEHLSRHRLNHRPRKVYNCLTCGKDFVRLDLFQRHNNRHERGMAYRKSGGFTSSGEAGLAEGKHTTVTVPSSALTSTAPTNSNSTPTLHADGGVEICGQLSHGITGDGVNGRGESSGDSHHSSAALPRLTYSVEEPDCETSSIGAGLADGEPDRILGVSWLGDKLDSVPLSFFDGPSDGANFTEDLDWLLSTGSWNLSEFGIVNVHNGAPGHSTTSPLSIVSLEVENAVNLESGFLTQRENILAALSTLPGQVLASSFFEVPNLEQFMRNYWDSYNPHFGLLHKPTFSVAEAPPLLLVALLTLGATLSPDKGHYEIAEAIHQSLRWLIYTSPRFQAPAPLWVIQALLIVQSYEKMFSSRKMHEMSHIFHSSVITLMRRGSCYSTECEHDKQVSTLEKEWRRWAERELSHRAAYFAFIMDAQHSSIFHHAASLSVTDIRLPLPCAEELWDAPTAVSWNRQRSRVPSSPLFLPSLRALLSRHAVPQSYSAFARFALLHGLFCLVRHMRSTEQTAYCMNVGEPRPTGTSRSRTSHGTQADDWQGRLDAVFDTWSYSLLSQSTSLCLEAAAALHRIAHVSIYVSLADFHILAGAPNLATGVRARSDSVQFKRAYKRVSTWTQHTDAKKVLRHCLLHVQETMFTRSQYAASEDRIILRPWVLYNTTLVLWAYGAVEAASRQHGCHSYTGTDAHWTAEEYLSQMLNAVGDHADPGECHGVDRTAGLIAKVANALSGSRWELLEEAKETLSNISTQSLVLWSMASTTPGDASDDEAL